MKFVSFFFSLFFKYFGYIVGVTFAFLVFFLDYKMYITFDYIYRLLCLTIQSQILVLFCHDVEHWRGWGWLIGGNRSWEFALCCILALLSVSQTSRCNNSLFPKLLSLDVELATMTSLMRLNIALKPQPTTPIRNVTSTFSFKWLSHLFFRFLNEFNDQICMLDKQSALEIHSQSHHSFILGTFKVFSISSS